MYQPVVLVTGFEPFGGKPRNPSWEAVAQLPEELHGCRIVKRQLPVEWFRCVHLLEAWMDELRPRAVISVGQGYPQPPIQVERIGMNICYGRDNTGAVELLDKPIFYNGPAAYFATYPYEAILRRMKDEGIPARYSFTAGQQQCNCVLYSALHLSATRHPGTLAGFIHVPMLPAEGIEGMALEESAKAVFCAVDETARAVAPQSFA